MWLKKSKWSAYNKSTLAAWNCCENTAEHLTQSEKICNCLIDQQARSKDSEWRYKTVKKLRKSEISFHRRSYQRKMFTQEVFTIEKSVGACLVVDGARHLLDWLPIPTHWLVLNHLLHTWQRRRHWLAGNQPTSCQSNHAMRHMCWKVDILQEQT